MRRRDWPERLATYVESTRNIPFAWGQQDCVLWASGAIREMTGLDPAGHLRGKYSDAPGAVAVLQTIAEDLSGAVATVAAEKGFEPIRPALARRGDLILFQAELVDPPHPAWPHCLGICMGKMGISPGPTGLVHLKMSQAIAAWRI